MTAIARHDLENRLTEEQVEHLREKDGGLQIGCIICENCGDNTGQAQVVDSMKWLPPRIVEEEWCYSCVRALPIERTLRRILPKEHDYEQ